MRSLCRAWKLHWEVVGALFVEGPISVALLMTLFFWALIPRLSFGLAMHPELYEEKRDE